MMYAVRPKPQDLDLGDQCGFVAFFYSYTHAKFFGSGLWGPFYEIQEVEDEIE